MLRIIQLTLGAGAHDIIISPAKASTLARTLQRPMCACCVLRYTLCCACAYQQASAAHLCPDHVPCSALVMFCVLQKTRSSSPGLYIQTPAEQIQYYMIVAVSDDARSGLRHTARTAMRSITGALDIGSARAHGCVLLCNVLGAAPAQHRLSLGLKHCLRLGLFSLSTCACGPHALVRTPVLLSQSLLTQICITLL